MKRALITTTINVPYNLGKFAVDLCDGDVIIVVGDQKSPHVDIVEFLMTIDTTAEVIYLPPSAQEAWDISDVTGWNCIQRRNIGTLEAIRRGVDWMYTVDDDNYIMPLTWATPIDDIFMDKGKYQSIVVEDESGWFNVGLACQPSVTHRGFPLSKRHTESVHTVRVIHEKPYPIGVFASLWLGSPDIDAIERIVMDPDVIKIHNPAVILEKGTWCPFNSQATAIRGELLPLFFMLPFVGRYDDIWASYFMRAWMDQNGWFVQYGEPLVMQERNEHNLVNDLLAELLGYEHTDDFTSGLRKLDLHCSPAEALLKYHSYLNELPYVPAQTMRVLEAWITDVNTAFMLRS